MTIGPLPRIKIVKKKSAAKPRAAALPKPLEAVVEPPVQASVEIAQN